MGILDRGAGGGTGHQFEVIGTEDLLRKFTELSNIGARTSQIKAALNRASKPMRMTARNLAKQYQSNTSSARKTSDGSTRPTLWKSITLLTSKRYRGVFWLGPSRKRRYKAYHGFVLETGTGRRVTKSGANRGTLIGKRFMRSAYLGQYNTVRNNIGKELNLLIQKIAAK